jgi:hypothetical protein
MIASACSIDILFRPENLDLMMRLCWNILTALILMLAPQISAWAQDNRSPGPNVNSTQNPPAAGSSDTGDTASEPKPQTPDTDLFALMTGTCSTLKIAGRDFACHTVAYAHSVQGRAYFTIALDDPADPSHIISFSGDNGQRTKDNLYDLPVDRMLLNSKSQPKADGLPAMSPAWSAPRPTGAARNTSCALNRMARRSRCAG